MICRRTMLSVDCCFLVQWTETNHTELWFFDASYSKCLDAMNKLEHSDFDLCIKKLTVDSLLSKCFILDAPILRQTRYSMENL